MKGSPVRIRASALAELPFPALLVGGLSAIYADAGAGGEPPEGWRPPPTS